MRCWAWWTVLLLFMTSAGRAADQPLRTWTDAGGTRHVEARLLSAENGRATFQRADGKTVSAAIRELSQADQHYIAAFAGSQAKAVQAPAAGLLATLLPTDAPPCDLVHVRVSHDFLGRDLPKHVVKRARLSDVILGSNVDSTSVTEGTPELVLVPDKQQGLLELRLTGEVRFSSTAHSGPIEIYNQGTTEFRAGKTIRFDGCNVQVEPARTEATTHMHTIGMDTNLGIGRRIALRIAEREMERKHAAAERETADHTARRINHALDEEVAANLGHVLRPLGKRLAQLADDEQLGVRRVQCSTTADYLEITLCGPGKNSLAAPEWQVDGADVQIAIHSSLVTRALTDADFRSQLQSLRDSVVNSAAQFDLLPVSLGANSAYAHRSYSIDWSPEQRWLMIGWNASPAEEQQTREEPTEAVPPAGLERSAAPLVVQGPAAP